MDTGSVQVLNVRVDRNEIDYGHHDIVEALAAIAGRSFRLPLAKEKVTVELGGVPTAVANALRRAVKDEIRGQCLTFDAEEFDRESTTDPFMEEDFVRTRIRMMPLCPQISETLVSGLRFALNAVNDTSKVMTVYSGDLKVTSSDTPTEPLFNPTHELAFLQPGRTLHISNIHLTEGFGYQDAAYTVGVRAAIRPLDLEEVPRSETHAAGGSAAERSGFVESSLVANPRRHEVTVTFPAVPAKSRASITVLVDTCGVIMRRLRYIQGVLETAQAGTGTIHRSTNAYFLITPDDLRTKGVLGIRDETDTIGNLVSRSVYELMPDISYVGYTCIPHERMMKLTVAHAVSEPADIGKIIARAVDHAYGVFYQIQRGIKAFQT